MYLKIKTYKKKRVRKLKTRRSSKVLARCLMKMISLFYQIIVIKYTEVALQSLKLRVTKVKQSNSRVRKGLKKTIAFKALITTIKILVLLIQSLQLTLIILINKKIKIKKFKTIKLVTNRLNFKKKIKNHNV